MASLKERVAAARERRPMLDHLLRMNAHYGRVKGNLQAGAVTYFAFLSFFPIMALAFFVVGWLAKVYPDAQGDLVDAIDQLLPGIIGTGDSQLDLSEIQKAAATVGIVGLVGVIYAGLGWLSAMRDALVIVFEVTPGEQPNLITGKLRDLVTLAIIGSTLLLSVAVSGFVSGFSTQILDELGLGTGLSPLLQLITVVVGLGANMVLFFALFALLARPHTPRRSLWSGALLGAIGFEVLKRLSSLLLGLVQDQPALQVFGIALILLVWINYFSRVVMYAASWAHTSAAARAEAALRNPPAMPEGPPVGPAVIEDRDHTPAPPRRPTQVQHRRSTLVHDNRARIALVAGGTAALALAAVLRRKKP